MKLCALFFALFVASTFAEEIWAPPTFNTGEIGRQFPKHFSRHIYPADDSDRRSADSGIRLVGIERTACYGTCPVYSLIVNRDGTFRYHGEKFTKHRGNWYGTVDAGKFATVLRYVAEMNYFGFADLYGVNESDLPGTFTLVQTRARKKVVYDYGSVGPAALVALEDMLDRLLEGAKWRRGD